MGRPGIRRASSSSCASARETTVFVQRTRAEDTSGCCARNRWARTAHARSSVPCVGPLPANAPDSIPDDYSHLNATIPSLIPGMRYPGIVMLSFNTNVTPAQRDSIVFAERLELVGGARIGWKGYGIWAFWIQDDSVASNARALAARLNQMPAIRSAMLTGLRRDVPNSQNVP